MLITSDALKLLKKANTIVFRRVGKTDTIELSKDDDWRFVLKEEVESYKVPRECFYLTSSYDPILYTVIHLLKAGDDVSIHWYKDKHTNDYVKKAQGYTWSELHSDSLELIVNRNNKRMVFEVGTVTCPDNSARMIR